MDKLLNDWRDAEIELRTRLERLGRARDCNLSTLPRCETDARETLHEVITYRGEAERELEPLTDEEMRALEACLEARYLGDIGLVVAPDNDADGFLMEAA